MVATGRSSMWWLRNHALPRTQAFLALVMWLSSTVSSMSSQTQPQKVHVAFSTTFSSGMGWSSKLLFLGDGNVEFLANLTNRDRMDFGMPGQGTLARPVSVGVHRMSFAFTQERTVVPLQMLKEFSALHFAP